MGIDFTDPFDSDQFNPTDDVVHDLGFGITHLEAERDRALCGNLGSRHVRADFEDVAGPFVCPLCAALARGDEDAVEEFETTHGGGPYAPQKVADELRRRLQERSRELKA